MLAPGARGEVFFKIERERVGEEVPEYLVTFTVETPEGEKTLSFILGGELARKLEAFEMAGELERAFEFLRDLIISKYLKIRPGWRLRPESIAFVRRGRRVWMTHGRPVERTISLHVSPETALKLALAAILSSEVKTSGLEPKFLKISVRGGEPLFTLLQRLESEARKHPLREARALVLRYAEMLERAVRELERVIRNAEQLARLGKKAYAEQYLRQQLREISAKYELPQLAEIAKLSNIEEVRRRALDLARELARYTRSGLEREVSTGKPWLEVLRRFVEEIGPLVMRREDLEKAAKLLEEAARIPESPTFRFRQLVEEHFRGREIAVGREWVSESIAENIRKLKAVHDLFRWFRAHYREAAAMLEKLLQEIKPIAEKTAREVLGLIELLRVGGIPSRILENIAEILGIEARSPAEVIAELRLLADLLEELGAEKTTVAELRRRIEEIKKYYLEELKEIQEARKRTVTV